MKPLLLYVITALILISCKTKKYDNPHIEIQTQYGDIELELYPKQAPKTVAAFLSNVDSGFYKDCSFYRVLNIENQPSNAPKTQLIQGGIWRSNNKKASSAARIPHESTLQTGLLHKNGTISMARLEPGTAGTEFFICIDDQPGLDYGGANIEDKQGYAAFGKVVKGMNIVRQVYNHKEEDQQFDPPVFIVKIRRL